jgi:DNA (cytosine-5)-methyltransferase 1
MDKDKQTSTFFGITEVAERLNVSQKTVRRPIASGKLKSIKIGGVYRVPIDSLDDFMNHNEIQDEEVIGFDLFGKKIFKADNFKSKKKTFNYKNNAKDNVNWVDIHDNWDNPKKSKLTFVDLFSGAGGITKGFELAGLNGICGMDWFEAAGKTYRRNFNHPFIEGDIKSPEKKKEFYETVKKGLKGKPLNLVAGGFPCQGFSMAGNRIATHFTGNY